MKLVIYFLNFAFSKSLNGTESETRDIANVHDEYYEVHEKMQNDMLSNVEHMMNKRSLLNKRFEPTGWLSSMMAGAISKFDHISGRWCKTLSQAALNQYLRILSKNGA